MRFMADSMSKIETVGSQQAGPAFSEAPLRGDVASAGLSTVAASPTNGVDIHGITLIYDGARNRSPLKILDNVSLNIKAGSFVCLIGPSGCGKSTLLSIVAGYQVPTSGSVRVNGSKADAPGPDRLMVFQSPALYPWLSVRENIAFGQSLRTQRGRSLPSPDALLTLIGLGGFASHYPHELSGGMRQRVEIARALAVDPGVMLMDEPFGALDSMTRIALQGELLRIWQETQKTIIFVTHDITEAVFLADRIVVMSRRPAGIRKVVEVDLPRPRHRDSVEVAALTHEVADLLEITL